MSQAIKERIIDLVADRWWELFGSLGHRLDSTDDEEKFIAHLDKIITYPSASELIAPPRKDRISYGFRYSRAQGKLYRHELIAPPVARLLELMLHSFFFYSGRWIYLLRTQNRTAGGIKLPHQWWALPETTTPTDRLGVNVQLNIKGRNYGWTQTQISPSNPFSGMSPTQKEDIAVEYGVMGDQDEWLEGIATLINKSSFRDGTVSIQFAGDYTSGGFPLAELIANGGHISGKKVEPINGNYLDCRPENLRTKSSRGRTMVCHFCRRPSTPTDSTRIKDSTGSSVRICHPCMKHYSA